MLTLPQITRECWYCRRKRTMSPETIFSDEHGRPVAGYEYSCPVCHLPVVHLTSQGEEMVCDYGYLRYVPFREMNG